MHDDLIDIAAKIEMNMRQTRLADIQIFMMEGEKERIVRILRGIEVLSEGTYLLGTGHYTSGIYRLSTDEVVIGTVAGAGLGT